MRPSLLGVSVTIVIHHSVTMTDAGALPLTTLTT
jgi:hypothetical protein